MNSDGTFLCWYCDIITYDYNPDNNTLVVIDLLADVIIYPDGRMKVADLDELYDAFDQELIDKNLLKKSLLSLNKLLDDIYTDGINSLTKPLSAWTDV